MDLAAAVRAGMPIGVLADVHGNSFALAAVLSFLRGRGVACLVHLGDCVWGPLDAPGTLALMRSAGMISIAGNQDRVGLEGLRAEDRDWLSALPATLAVSPELFLCHGTPGSDTTYLLHEATPGGVRLRSADLVESLVAGVTERVILCGHTHLTGSIILGSGQVVANPGSVGLPAYSDDVPYPHAMEAGSPEARFAVLESGNLELLSVEYDCESAALMAERNGRPDWGFQLRTGRVSR